MTYDPGGYFSSGASAMDWANSYGQMATMYSNNAQFYSQQNLYSPTDSQSGTSNTGGKTGHNVRKTKPKPRVTTTYRESPTVHKQILGKFTRYLKTRVTSKADADSLCRDFESQDVMAAWAKGVAAIGLKWRMRWPTTGSRTGRSTTA